MAENISSRIFRARKAAGLTQEELGRQCGVTRQAVSRWELEDATRGSAPSRDALLRIAQITGVTLD